MTAQNESGSSLKRLRIANAAFDPSTGDVDFGDRQVRLAPKVGDLLAELALARGAVLSKEALLSRVWGDTYVGADAVWRGMSELRAAFEEVGITELIETLPRRGYRLLAEVEEIPESDGRGHKTHDAEDGVSAGQDASALSLKETDPRETDPRMRRVGVLAATLLIVALGLSGWKQQRLAAATDQPDLHPPDSDPMALILTQHQEQQQKALAIRRSGADPGTDLTAVGFDALVRSATVDTTEDSLAVAGDIMSVRGRPGTALQLYQAATEAGSTHSDLRDRAQRALQQVRSARAAALADAQVSGPEAYLERARARRLSEDLQGALNALGVVLRQDPGFEPAILEFVRIQLTLGDLAKARETLRRSLALLPESMALLNVAAEVELLVGDLPRALGYLDRACLAWANLTEAKKEPPLEPRPLLCWM